MSRSLIPLTLILFAAALLAVPAAFAKGGKHPAITVRGVCTQQSTSKLKLAREDRGTEVEFQVDQNRNGVPWKVTLRRNGNRVASFTATTRAPSGSFEIHRVIARRTGSDRVTAVATRSGEACRAAGNAPKAAGGASKATGGTSKATGGTSTGGSDDPAGHDAGDDHGHGHGADG